MTSILKKAPTFSRKLNYTTLLTGASLVCLGLLIGFGFYRQQQKLASEHALLQTIYSMAALPEEATPNQLLVALSQYASEHEEARRSRIARLAGLEPDWMHILQRINRLSPVRRSEVYLAMAKEYRIPDTWTPAELERRVLLEQNRPRIFPMPLTASRANID